MKWIFLIIAMIGVGPVFAADLPARKPGLWEIKTTIDGRNPPTQTIKQCVDAATDQITMSITGPFSQAVCPKRDMSSSGDSITVNSNCTIGKSTANVSAVITGSLDSAYTMTVRSEGAGLPGGTMTMSIVGTRLSDCSAEQKPGDIIFSNGRTVNILEAQKHVPSDVPLPPSQPSPQ